LAKVHISAAIAEAKAARSQRTEITQDMVLREIAKVAFLKMSNFLRVDANGQPQIDLSGVTGDELDALSEFQTETVLERGGGSEQTNYIRKTRIRFHNKLIALEKLARHTGVYEKEVVNAGDAFGRLIEEIQRRGSRAPINRSDA